MKVCETKRKIEIVNNEYIRMNITEGEVIAIPNRQKLYKGTLKHLAEIKERNHPTIADMKELYHDFVEGREMPLDTYRIEVTDLQSKQMILDGLLELLLGISDGKIYNVELNPLNFIAEDSPQNKTVYVKAFFREGKELSEITDKWLEDAKKLIGYFLVSDTGYNASNFNSLRPADFLKGLQGNVRDQYLKIMKSPSIDHMAQDWFHETKYKQIKNFPEMIKGYQKPIDVTTIGKSLYGTEEDEETDDADNLDEINEPEYEEKPKPKAPPKRKKERKAVPPQRHEKKTGKGRLVVFLVVGIILGVLVSQLFFKGSLTGVKASEPFYEGLLKTSIQKYAEASEKFDMIPKEELAELEESERLSVFYAYLKDEQYDKALEVEPDGAESVVSYLIKREKLDTVKTVKSELPAIAYEKAVFSDDYEKVIELKEQVKDTTKRQEDVVKALAMTGDFEPAVEYVKKKGLEHKRKDLEHYLKEYEKKEKLTKADKDTALKAIKELN